jgi:hypothetical protein
MITVNAYELVLADSAAYPRLTPEGKFYEWWADYIRQLGHRVALRPLAEVYDLQKHEGRVVGVLGMTIPSWQRRHVAAADCIGIVDPAWGFPNHLPFDDYIARLLPHGFVFDSEFLAVSRDVLR